MPPTTRESLIIDQRGQKLFAVVHRPALATAVPAVAIFHGFLASKDQPHRMLVDLAESLAQAGILALRVDLRGRGDSEGDSRDITPGDDLADAQETLNTLAAVPGVDANRLAVAGLSWGGLLSAVLAGRDARVKACAILSAVPTETLDWQPTFETIDGREVAENWAMLVGRPFYDELRDFHPLTEIQRARGPVLLVHGTTDDSVPVDQIEAFQAAMQPGQVDVIPVEGADHIFFTHRWKQQALTATVEWLKRVL